MKKLMQPVNRAALARETRKLRKAEITLQRLVTDVRAVRNHRQMNAAESPIQQDAWDRLTLSVLEAERILRKTVDKSKN